MKPRVWSPVVLSHSAGGGLLRAGAFGVLLAALILGIPLGTACLAAGLTERVSIATDGTEGNSFSMTPHLSCDGRYVAFHSSASNLVSGGSNGDVFLRDRRTSITTRVSVATDGTQGDGPSGHDGVLCISATGRFVAFASWATNLVAGDTNGVPDIFLRDRQRGETTRVSVASDGTQGIDTSWGEPSVSADGRYVAFDSGASNLVGGDTNGLPDVLLRDCSRGETTRVSVASDGTQGNGLSGLPSISADGRYVAFWSSASNLVSGDNNGSGDVFLHDCLTGETTLVSVASDGTQGNGGSLRLALSADGRYVAFQSGASNLVSGDINGTVDVFVHDCQTGQTVLASVASDGTPANGASFAPSISADGRYVAFESPATNLVSGDNNGTWDVFLHDCLTGETTLVSVASDGTQGNYYSGEASLSADGRYVAFESVATNLVPGDTNGILDVFVRWLETGFSGNPNRGKLPLEVRSTDLSDGSPTSWAWDFGDGAAASEQNPLHTYTSPGRYTVSLTASGPGGTETTSKTNYISVSFTDVPILPVDPFDFWALNQILACVEAGIVKGYGGGSYKPSLPVTRDQMAVFISRALAGGDAQVPSGPEIPHFPDVGADHWAYKHIEYCFAQHVVEGLPSGYYRPTWSVDRAQMAVYIARAMVAPAGDSAVPDPDEPPAPHFTDVNGTNEWSWCYKHVEYCYDHDVVRGYGDGTYRPHLPATRDQMAVYIQRAFQLPM